MAGADRVVPAEEVPPMTVARPVALSKADQAAR